MDWRISKLAYLADFALVPLYALGATALGLFYAEPTMLWTGFFALGFIAWTLTEYWMHRSLFHRLYRQEHGLHHIRPLDWIGLAPYITGTGFFVLWLICVEFFGGVGRGGAVFSGYVTGYYAYIVIHILIHHTKLSIVASLRATHEMHHSGAERNFGVSTNFWDHVFRTYKRPLTYG